MSQKPDAPIRVFVHLSHGVDAERWRIDWERGAVIGVNESSPYGYDRANEFGCDVRYSVPGRENAMTRLVRLGVRAVAGFDLVHAWRNREGIRAANVVWTHTETQGLAVSALLWFRPRAKRPGLLLQNVWLIDRWSRYPAPHRVLFRRLLRRADILTFHSQRNRDTAARLLAPARCEVVMFGIRADEKHPARTPHRSEAPRVLSLGNDEHRDWATCAAAVSCIPGASLTVLSRNFPTRLADGVNARVLRVKSNAELADLFHEADVVLVALKPNEHASGLTVLQEATLYGVPVVATDTGGLTDYFDASMVEYVPPGDETAIVDAIERVLSDPEASRERVQRAQDRMSPDHISSAAFVRRHVELSRDILDRPASE